MFLSRIIFFVVNQHALYGVHCTHISESNNDNLNFSVDKSLYVQFFVCYLFCVPSENLFPLLSSIRRNIRAVRTVDFLNLSF